MIPLEAIGLTLVAQQVMPLCTAGVELRVRMLAVVASKHPHVCVVAIELRRVRPRA
jgi:hypothetical protein